MAANFTKTGTEVQVNIALTADIDLQLTEPVTGSQSASDVATMTDGRYFVAYQDTFSVGTDQDIYGQFVNADGTLSGGSIRMDFQTFLQTDPAVAARSGGGAVVVYSDAHASAGANSDIYLRTVSSTGVLNPANHDTPGLEVAGNTVFSQTFNLDHPDVATFTNGNSLVVFEADLSGTDHDIDFRVLNAAGTGFTTASVGGIDTSSASLSNNPAVASVGNNALVVYEDTRGGGTTDIRASFFNGTTETASTSTLVADSPTNNLGNADVAALADGRYIVVWQNQNDLTIAGRFVDAAGVPVGSTFAIAGGGISLLPHVAGLPDGGFVVTYENEFGPGIGASGEGTSLGVFEQRFDASGVADGDRTLVNTGDTNAQFDPAIASNLSTGAAFITFTDGTSHTPGDNDPNGIRGDAFLATTDTVTLTAGDDVFQGTSLGETVNGGAGNDVLLGGAGNDTLNGGDGNDALNGGAGNDIMNGGAGGDALFGGAGNDTMDGGDDSDIVRAEDGDDIVHGGNATDIVQGDAGNDQVFGDDGDDKISGGLGDDTVDGGNGDDFAFGEQGNDTVIGGAGNDAIFGGSGTDNMQGGSGNDIVNGQTGNDTIDGGTGNDTLTGESGIDTFVFSAGMGQDTITDFGYVYGPDNADGTVGPATTAGGANNEDHLNISSALAPNFAFVQSHATQVSGPGGFPQVVIDFGGGNTLTITNFHLSDLTSADVTIV